MYNQAMHCNQLLYRSSLDAPFYMNGTMSHPFSLGHYTLSRKNNVM